MANGCTANQRAKAFVRALALVCFAVAALVGVLSLTMPVGIVMSLVIVIIIMMMIIRQGRAGIERA